MLRVIQPALSAEQLAELVETIRGHADRKELDQSWAAAEPLLAAAPQQRLAALALLRLVDQPAFSREHGREIAESLFEAHGDDPELTGVIGDALSAVHAIEELNGPPPQAPIFTQVARRLCEHATTTRGSESEEAVLSGLSTLARLLGRTWDEAAEDAYRRLVMLRPERWEYHYALGLFFKTRGRFTEGLAANQRAAELGGGERDAVRWNLGICATGARDAEPALKVWKSLGQKIEMGRFGLPEGSYPSTKVRLAERPLAERDPDLVPDDPGKEETIWVERLSPCHGVVRCALYADLGVDYGDVVMFDGAPITYHKYGDQTVPVFPHLVTLERGDYRIYSFAGTQREKHQIADLSKALPRDAVLYVHSEQLVMLCSACASDTATDHATHQPAEHRVVLGKLCSPPDIAAVELRLTLDAIIAAHAGIQLYVADLSADAGDEQRAEVEARRADMITSNNDV